MTGRKPGVHNKSPWPDRFRSRLRPDPSGCLLWTGTVHHLGYGVIRTDFGQERAHRVAYRLAHGAIPAGLMVCHTCDVRLCCLPDHLYLGTAADNMRDRDQRGRRVDPTGERNGQAVLTVADVLEIRRQVRGGMTRTAVAELRGLSRQHIGAIVAGDKWRSVT